MWNDNYKFCNKCSTLKELNEFYFNKKTNKPRPLCKDCEKLKSKEYRMKNSEKIYKYNVEYKKRNQEKVKNNARKYYLDNREKLIEYQKEYNIKKTIRELKMKLNK